MKNPSNELITSMHAIKGCIVRNVQDVKLGEIEDLVLDITSGQIVYVILLVHTGLIELNNKYFIIPWEAFHYDLSHEQEPAVILDIAKDELEKTFGYNNDSELLTPLKLPKTTPKAKSYHSSSFTLL